MAKATAARKTPAKPKTAPKKAQPVVVASEPLFNDSVRRQVYFWIGTLVALIVFLFVFRSILLPFIAGIILAYILDPVADKLEAMGANRLLATVIILIVFVILFVLALVSVIPVFFNQMKNVIEDMPTYINFIQDLVARDDVAWLRNLLGDNAENIKNNVGELIQQSASWATTVLGSIWNSGKALIDVISLLVITPIVAFYLLLDWDRIVARIDGFLPRDHKVEIEQIAFDINKAIAGFIRGQGGVCLILGSFYALGLTLLGLSGGLLIGMIAGLISFIPFVGSLVGAVLALGAALYQFWPDYMIVILVGLVFAAGQFFEGNILQPKLVGESVGLHPVWLMFSLSAFGLLMGFTGLLIAVPVAASIAVLVRYALSRYLKSDFYLGHNSDV